MAGEPTTTLTGNLTSDPEIRFTPSGTAVANLTIANTPRTKKGDQWADGETWFVRATAWRDLAENCAESLVRGTRVIAVGRLKYRSWEDKNGGGTRGQVEMELDAIGPDLSRATARVVKVAREKPANNPQAPVDDPWAAGPSDTTEPPF